MKDAGSAPWLVVATNATFASGYTDWLSLNNVRTVVVWAGDRQSPSPADYAALLLAGGGDVAPALYGEAAEPETANVNEARDRLEILLIRDFLLAGKPVLGICRGLQIVNVALGGGLIQDIPRRLAPLGGPPVERHRSDGDDDAMHAVATDSATRLGAALRGITAVNSAHHQAIAPERMARGLRVVCRSPAGVIEAVEGLERPTISAVQWHPERLPADHPASSRLLAFWRRMTAGSPA